MKLTKAIKQKHYDLWDWLYNNPAMEKDDYPKWHKNGGKLTRPYNTCFLCEIYLVCGICILTIKSGTMCRHGSNWFSKWNKAKTTRTRKKYAKLIRDIFVEEVKE